MMKRDDFNAALESARHVFVGVDFYDGQGEYVEVSKESIKRSLKSPIAKKWSVKAEVDKDGDLYIG